MKQLSHFSNVSMTLSTGSLVLQWLSRDTTILWTLRWLNNMQAPDILITSIKSLPQQSRSELTSVLTSFPEEYTHH